MEGSRMCATRGCMGLLFHRSAEWSAAILSRSRQSTKGPELDIGHLSAALTNTGFHVYPESPEVRPGSQGDLPVDGCPAKYRIRVHPTWPTSHCIVVSGYCTELIWDSPAFVNPSMIRIILSRLQAYMFGHMSSQMFN